MRPSEKREEELSASRMAWCAFRWESMIWTISLPTWINLWQRFSVSLCSLGHRLFNPFQITFIAAIDLYTDAFRQFVRMKFFDRILHTAKQLLTSLDHKQPFFAFFNLLLPPVNRFNLRDEVHTSRQAAFH